MPSRHGEEVKRMPTVLRHGPYRFFFWSRENREPPHVHVAREGLEAKLWIEPIVEVAQNWGFGRRELNEILKLTERRRGEILKAWHEHFDQD